jgi:hypothetical protein
MYKNQKSSPSAIILSQKNSKNISILLNFLPDFFIVVYHDLALQ